MTADEFLEVANKTYNSGKYKPITGVYMITADEFVEVANKTYNAEYKPVKNTWFSYDCIGTELGCCPLAAYAIAMGCEKNTAEITNWLDSKFGYYWRAYFEYAIDSDYTPKLMLHQEAYDLGKAVKEKLGL